MRYKTKLGEQLDTFSDGVLISRVCSKCKVNKSINLFYKNYRKREGYENYCIECQKNISKVYRKENKDKVNACARAYHKKDPEIRRNLLRSWHKKNPGKKSEYDKKYCETHIRPHSIYSSRRRARIRDVGGDISLFEWENILKFYDHTCLWCGRNDVKLTIDHIIPLSRGGKNSVENIQPLCKICNCKKHTKSTDYRGNKIYGQQ